MFNWFKNLIPKDKYAVILSDPGDKKVNVIKTIRRHTGLELKESKALVDTCPSEVVACKPYSEASQICEDLREAGALSYIRSC